MSAVWIGRLSVEYLTRVAELTASCDVRFADRWLSLGMAWMGSTAVSRAGLEGSLAAWVVSGATAFRHDCPETGPAA
jgi:hypothetical protein